MSQRFHAALNGGGAQLDVALPRADFFAQLVGHFEELKNTGSPEIAGVVAFDAARAPVIGPVFGIGAVEFNQIDLASWRLNFLFAFRADDTDEPLGNEQFNGGGHQVGLHADID